MVTTLTVAIVVLGYTLYRDAHPYPSGDARRLLIVAGGVA